MNLSSTDQIKTARQHTIGDILRRSAARYPEKIAIQCGNVEWTYFELDKLANQIGRGLLNQGVVLGDRVAIVARNSHSFAALRFALARIGAVLVPVNFMLNAEEISYILRSSGAKMLAIGPEFIEVGNRAKEQNTKIQITLALPGENLPFSDKADIDFTDLITSDGTPSH
jgi:fatty-acyl-CoA synthase